MTLSGKRVKALPHDENRHPLSAMIAAVVSGGNIVEYLPLKAVDNADGTATLSSTVNVTLDADVDIGNLHLLNTSDAKINPATEEKQDALLALDYATETTLAAILADTASLDASIDVALSTRATEATLATRGSEATLATRATEATLALVKTVLDGIKTAVDAINATSDVALSTRASEATLSTVKDNTGLDDKSKSYDQSIAVATTFNVQTDMDTKFSVTGSIVRTVTISTNLTVTLEINADGETLTIVGGEPITIDNFNFTSIKLTPTVATNVRVLATGFGGA